MRLLISRNPQSGFLSLALVAMFLAVDAPVVLAGLPDGLTQIIITKAASGGEVPNFGYSGMCRIDLDNDLCDSDEGDFGNFTVSAGGTATFDFTHAGGDPTQDPTGTYTVDELLPENWRLADVTCVTDEAPATEDDSFQWEWDPSTGQLTINLDEGETIECTFTNVRISAAIAITKECAPTAIGDPTFGFEVTIPDDDPANLNLSCSETAIFDGLSGGAYRVSENVPPSEWTLDGIDCNVEPSVGAASTFTPNVDGGYVDINLGVDELVACRFGNEAEATPTPTATSTPTPTSTATNTATETPTQTLVPIGGSCTETSECENELICIESQCREAAAPAPAASGGTLVIALAVLALIAGLAIMGKRETSH